MRRWALAAVLSLGVVGAARADEDGTVSAQLGHGVVIRSADGDFSLQIRGRAQVQAFATIPGDGQPDLGFMIRRARLQFRARALDERLGLYLQFGFAPRDMEADLLIPVRDAQISWTFSKNATITAGQMKVPFNRQRLISSSALQLVDRSIVNAELTLDRDMGVKLSADDVGGLGKRFGYAVGVYAGDGRLRVNKGPGLLYAARVQAQPIGPFDDVDNEADLSRDPRPRLSLGAAFAFNHDAQRQRSTNGEFWTLGGFDALHWTGDLLFKVAGWSLQGEVIGRETVGEEVHTDEVDGVLVEEVARDAVGVMAQTGFVFPGAPVELSARYAQIVPTGDVRGLVASREVGAALGWYPRGHAVKIQADWVWQRTGDAQGQQVRVQTQVFF